VSAARTVVGWLGVGVLAAACSAKPADCVGSSELPVRPVPPLASATPISSASPSSSPLAPKAPPPNAPKGDVCHIVDDGPHRVAFSWNDAKLWRDIERTNDERTVLAWDTASVGFRLELVDGKMIGERDTDLDAFDGSFDNYHRSNADAPRHGPWGKGEITVDTWDRYEISIWFPGEARQRLHEITAQVQFVTFASHASGVAVVGYAGNNYPKAVEPFILRWSNGNARRRVRENFPGTWGAPDVVMGPDGSPWLMLTSSDDDEKRGHTLRVLKLVKNRWVKMGQWGFQVGGGLGLTPNGDAWLLLGHTEEGASEEQGGLWRLPAGRRKWERIAPDFVGPCRRYSTQSLIPIADNRLMMFAYIPVEGTTSCEVRDWAAVELRLDDAIDPAFAARCASLPAPARRGASP